MPERYVAAILKFLSDRSYQPVKPRQLARQMHVSDSDYGTFREAIKDLHSGGRIVMGSGNALMLPAIDKQVVGLFRAHPKGFGFVIPESPNAHGDLYVPKDGSAGAMSGDRVVAEVQKRGKRDGQNVLQGKIVKILARGQRRVVGTLQQTEGTWFVIPDGREMTVPVVLPDASEAAGAQAGLKVVAEIVTYAEGGDLPRGVISETLGREGTLAVETKAIVRAYELAEGFGQKAMDDARAAADAFDAGNAAGREDLTDLLTITIDPPEARDFDDAISLQREGPHTILGVHIADVSHFVVEGSALDGEARRRSTSVYFPSRVVPMLPEVLSNGVCSLQEGQKRFAKSVLIVYDADGHVVGQRVAETVICSDKRLTYIEAQSICDGKIGGFDQAVVRLVKDATALARKIEVRRREAGMLHLELPEIELSFNKAGDVTDVQPADDSYTHTVIEMFMVAANEAVAEILEAQKVPFLRRTHPAPEASDNKELGAFVRACGHKIPAEMDRRDIQALLAAVRGQPTSYAVNLAVLRMMQQAVYSPMHIGHFALASRSYCHFTSPIRRYPDLTVHRLVAAHCRGQLQAIGHDISALTELGEHSSTTERRAAHAESELKQVLVLRYLSDRIGDVFEGVITGVANVGLFVQLHPYGVDGLIRMADLGDDWWDVSARYGQMRGERTGKRYRVGDAMRVRIVVVDPARRELGLAPESTPTGKTASKSKGKAKGKSKAKPNRRSAQRPGKGARAKARAKAKAGNTAPGRRRKSKG